MGKVIIYHDGIQEEVDEELVKIYEPFPKESKNEKGSDSSSRG